MQFEQRAVQDRLQSEAQGHVVFKDVNYITLTMPGGKQVFDAIADEYLAQKRRESIDNRYPKAWIDYFDRAYEEWKKGNDVPVNGTPIKHWPVVSRAEIAQLAAANVLTIEDLAEANESVLQTIGMGARTMRDKARAWLDQANNAGKVAERVANLEEDIRRRDQLIESLGDRLKELETELGKRKKAA